MGAGSTQLQLNAMHDPRSRNACAGCMGTGYIPGRLVDQTINA